MCPDLSRIRVALGYEPQFSLEATMERVVS